MKTHVKDLTVNELKVLINATVEHSLNEFLEDQKALSSPGYIKSIAKAREDYRKGRTKKFKDVFRVSSHSH